MAVPTAEKLEYYYPLKILAADGGAITALLVDAGGDDTNIICDQLTQANDYWNGAIGRFETGALAGEYFHVKDFDAGTDKLTLARPLSAAPGIGDTFRMFFGGKWRSNQEVPGLDPSTPVDVTGVTIDRAGHANLKDNSALNANGTLRYYTAGTELSWQAPDDGAEGARVNVGGGGAFVIYSDDTDKWLEVTVAAGSLPAGDETDTINVAFEEGRVVPDLQGYETSQAGGKNRYHLVVVKNGDGADTMAALEVQVLPDESAASTTTTTTRAAAAGFLDVTSAAGWASSGFWLYNSTRDDVRYVQYRSGNRCYCAAAGAGLRGFASVAWQIGDTVYPIVSIDLGLDAPAALQFEDPADEETAPGGVSFVVVDPTTPLVIGNLASAGIYGIWVRETVVDPAAGETYARADFLETMEFNWS